MSSPEKNEYVHDVFTKIAPSYDRMNDLESLGLHRLWKAQLVRDVSRTKPRKILDVACGTGDITIALAKENPEAHVIGLDFCEDMLEIARERATEEFPVSFVVKTQASSESGKKRAAINRNVQFVYGDAMQLPFEDDSFDALSISFGLRNLPDFAAALAEMYRVLKPSGRFYCLEASYPTSPVVKPPFKLYFKHWLPTLGKIVADSPEEYSWLNTSTEAFVSKGELSALMLKTGFCQVDYTSLMLGAAALHYGTKKSA